MIRRSVAVALWLALPTLTGAQREHVLVEYHFDREAIATGPYTVSVFEHSQGSVALTSHYRFSGFRAVEIRDVAGDGDFAELQGYFPVRQSGWIFAHFAFMTATPEESFNIALAGPAHFYLKRDGIAFWLTARAGTLYQVSAEQAAELFRLRPFTWYVADMAYDIGRGVYDLTIVEEQEEQPIVELRRQPNAVGLPASVVDKFSFIGDPPGEDGSNVHLYVDDVVISADEPMEQGPFVAPGRRMLFVDIWDYWRARFYQEPHCPAVLEFGDFGFSTTDLQILGQGGHGRLLDRLGARSAGVIDPPASLDPYLAELVQGVNHWRCGCGAAENGEFAAAQRHFRRARTSAPDAKLYPMSSVLTLAARDRWREADELLVSIYPDWHDDPRFPALSAILGIARGDLGAAEMALMAAAMGKGDDLTHPLLRDLWGGRLDVRLVARLKTEFPDSWSRHVEAALSAEHRYYVLLWQERHDEALGYAELMARRFDALGLSPGRWVERQGDVAFYQGDYQAALELYSRAAEELGGPTSVLLKLSDVHFKLGDAEGERRFRELIYGSLTED